MGLSIQILRSFIISMIAIVFIILAVLFPRHLTIVRGEFGISLGNSKPIMTEFGENINNFFHELIVNHSLGPTRDSLTTVGEAVMTSMGNSIVIIVTTFFLTVVFGTLKGILDYKLSKSKYPLFGNWTTWFFQSIPDFMLMVMIQFVVIRYLQWIPFFPQGRWSDFILPSILVSLHPITYLARITSASFAMQEGELYIRVARAKGISERSIVFKHMLRNSTSTILTHISPLFVYILSNLLMVEIFSNYPGAAQRMFLAIDYNRSYGTGTNYEPGIIIGIACCFMIMLLFIQIISLIMKQRIDPR